MKKAPFISLLLFAGMTNPLFAQSDSLSREVGFSTQILFDQIFESNGAPFEFILKSQRNENQWMRYGISTSLNLSENDKVDDDEYEDYSYQSFSFQISPSVGVEKRVLLSHRWHLIYGSDLAVNYSQLKSKSHRFLESESISYNCQNHQASKSYGADLRPFIGLLFSPVKRLYVSTEASAFLGGAFMKRKVEQYQHDLLTNKLNEEQWNLKFGLRPASAIFVYYRF